MKTKVTFVDEVSSNNIISCEATEKLLCEIEDKIRNASLICQTSLDEFLKDFDHLRTGFVTKEQFDRCLNQHLNIVLEHDEDNILMQKYGHNYPLPRMLNYRSLCQTIDSISQPKTKSKQSAYQESDSFYHQESSHKEFMTLLERIAPYYQYHGINIKTCYKDFDLHNIGLVTESQFYRCFPGPSDVNADELKLLAHHYFCPNNKGMCDYLEFHKDIVNIINASNESKKILHSSEIQHIIKGKVLNDANFNDVLEKIKVATFKNGIRSTEFFIDHDKLRSGLVTKNQFICGIQLCCGEQANLSSKEIDLLIEHYTSDDGRVRYREFCHVVENAFNVPELEKNPSLNVYRPPVGALAQKPNMLKDEEEERVCKILFQLREVVKKKRLMLTYFKDFDQGKCYTQGMSKTCFNRMLHMVGLDIQPSDLEVVYRKFEYPVSGDINYPAFIKCIDQEYYAKPPVSDDQDTTKTVFPSSSEKEICSELVVDVNKIIKQISHHIFVYRIRIAEFFQDYDPLRHGSIPISRFRMGLSASGQQFTEQEINALLKKYQDINIKENILWLHFVNDVEKVFNQKSFEKSPTIKLVSSEDILISKASSNWESQSDETKNAFDNVIQSMKEKIDQRRTLTKPFFQDFDKHHRGYVTKSQFCQCMTYLNLSFNEEDIDIVYKRFSDAAGFNYIKFLDELQPAEKYEHIYLKRINDLKILDKAKIVEERKDIYNDERKDNIYNVMNKIRSKVFRESIRIHEFMKDFDKLRTGKMLKINFPRALNISSLRLTAYDIDTVMDFYKSEGNSNYVDYNRFCDDVDSVFTTKGLEVNPTLVPIQYKPKSKNSLIQLSSDAEEMIETVVHQLADRVRIRRIQLFPLFEDYDRFHNGTVSRSQLHRVLSELELGSIVSEQEFHALYEKFLSVIGGKLDFNYKAFCDMVNNYANFDPNFP
ncbi:uncharacterized protein LOC100202524 isoform X2 [Hydra vulgaris]|uniref:Uncharacterized protein LOC100202524 isoform X2 n=1 Tax=Hydra vulgaris TaxID=6087 RepID=A0ABM4BTJ6_HYDVU